MSAPARDFMLLGYFLKHVAKPDRRFPLAENAEEICSVSNCISEAPEGWIDKWFHNKYFFYDSEAVAQEAAGDTERYEIFAYRVLPQRFDKHGASPIELAAPGVAPLSESYELLGYDVVQCWQKLEDGMPIECSPLSCNGMSAEIPVNRHCLIETIDAALVVAQRFGSESDGVEPGPYYLFEVWRRRRESVA